MPAFSIASQCDCYVTPYGVVSDSAVSDMRDWLMDVAWSNMEEEDFNALQAEQIIRAVHRYYDGGIEGFLRA